MKISFYFRNTFCFTFKAKKKTCVLIWYMHAASSILRSLDSVYHASIRVITNTTSLTHHRILYDLMGWASLTTCRQQHWYIFIYKAINFQLTSVPFSAPACALTSCFSSWWLFSVPWVLKQQYGVLFRN